MTRTLFTAIFLTLFSQTAWAEVVFYCTGTNFIQIENHKPTTYINEKFKFSIDEKRILYGSNHKFLKNMKMAVTYWKDENNWAVSAADHITRFKDGVYSFKSGFAIKNDVQTTVITAKCDKF